MKLSSLTWTRIRVIVNIFFFSFVFLWNLNAFVARFQHSHIRALCIFFGREGYAPLSKSEGARTPMADLHRQKTKWSLKTDCSETLCRKHLLFVKFK